MKCTNCNEEITGKESYFQTKIVCKNCFERLRYADRHCSLEKMQEIIILRTRRRREATSERLN